MHQSARNGRVLRGALMTTPQEVRDTLGMDVSIENPPRHTWLHERTQTPAPSWARPAPRAASSHLRGH